MDDKPIKALLIEDNPDDVRLIRELVAEVGTPAIELECVNRLATGMARLVRREVDVVLLDLSLPDSRGLDTFYKACAQAPGLPIIVLSGLADEKLAIRTVREGAQDYLIKNQTNSQLLVRAIRNAIERRRLLKELLGRARHDLLITGLVDRLTDLYNQRAFFALAERQLKIANRTKRELLLLCAAADNLKWINATRGRSEGDLVLVEIANLLKNTFRDPDIIARIGGDEFAVLAVNAPPASVEILTARLHENLEALNAQTGRPYKLSLRVGVACYDPQTPYALEELMASARRLMAEHRESKTQI